MKKLEARELAVEAAEEQIKNMPPPPPVIVPVPVPLPMTVPMNNLNLNSTNKVDEIAVSSVEKKDDWLAGKKSKKKSKKQK